jgi:hypothetical protein
VVRKALRFEIRPREAVLIRVFVHFHGNKVVLLRGGYDKGKDPKKRRQDREVEKASKNLTAWRARQQAKKKRR